MQRDSLWPNSLLIALAWFGQSSQKTLHPHAGLGNRGSSAVGRLIEHGKVSGAELWCLDHDPKGLEAVSSAHGGSSNVIVIPKAEPVSPQCWIIGKCLHRRLQCKVCLTCIALLQKPGTSSVVCPEDLARIVGPGAYDKDGQGNVNVGDGGVAFLLAATSSLPGGAPTVSWQDWHD